MRSSVRAGPRALSSWSTRSSRSCVEASLIALSQRHAAELDALQSRCQIADLGPEVIQPSLELVHAFEQVHALCKK